MLKIKNPTARLITIFSLLVIILTFLFGSVPTVEEYWGAYPLLVQVLSTIVVILCTNLIYKIYAEGEIRATIAKEIRDEFEKVLESTDHRIKSLKSCGLERIYLDRKEAEAEILNKLGEVQETAWFTGVAFSEKLNLKTLISAIPDKKINDPQEKLDIRVLLMDVLKSPAVYRSFLEEPKESARQMALELKNKNILHPYLSTKIYNDFSGSYSFLGHSNIKKEKIRFFGHNPNCWIILIDDVAYYQPYSFGGEVDKKHGTVIGTLLPVFKFKKTESSSTFFVLKRHLEKLWSTSNTNYKIMGYRVARAKEITEDVFERRLDWLRHVYSALYIPEKRKSLRCCSAKGDALAIIDSKRKKYTCVVKNNCEEGIGISLSPESYFHLKEGDILTLKAQNDAYIHNMVSDLLYSQNPGKTDKGKKFRVIHPKEVSKDDRDRWVVYWSELPIEDLRKMEIEDPGNNKVISPRVIEIGLQPL